MKRRRVVFALMALMVVAAAMLTPRISIDADPENMLPADQPDRGRHDLEWTRQHQRLVDNARNPAYVREEFHHVLTARLTYAMNRDNLRWSLFTFYSPSDRDYSPRPAVHYRWSDAVSTTLGGNLFGGEQRHKLFAQLNENSNFYGRSRYS